MYYVYNSQRDNQGLSFPFLNLCFIKSAAGGPHASRSFQLLTLWTIGLYGHLTLGRQKNKKEQLLVHVGEGKKKRHVKIRTSNMTYKWRVTILDIPRHMQTMLTYKSNFFIKFQNMFPSLTKNSSANFISRRTWNMKNLIIFNLATQTIILLKKKHVNRHIQ